MSGADGSPFQIETLNDSDSGGDTPVFQGTPTAQNSAKMNKRNEKHKNSNNKPCVQVGQKSL